MANDGIRVHVYGDYNDKDIKKAQRDLESLRKTSTDATSGISNSFKDMGSKLSAVGASVSAAGKKMTLGVTLPLVAIGASAVTLANDFESSMTKIVSLVGIAADEVAVMETAVLKLAGETAKAPAELADALFVLTSAGLRGDDALSALDASAKASAAGLGETADISRALAGAMNAYGSEVLSAASATDIIVATARAGNFETSQFAGAIGRVLPFAQQAGASFADMGGAVALLTRTNGDAAQSVTQMSALFRAFVVPTEQAKKALDGIGLTAQDVRDSIGERGLVETLGMLDKKLGGNREELGRLLGSSEAAAAAFQILDANAETLAGTFGLTADAAGITDEAFGVTAETGAFKMQSAFENIKIALIQLGDIIAPTVTQFVEFFTGLIEQFQALSPEVKEFIVKAALIAAAIGPVLMVVGSLISALGGAVSGIGAIGGAIGVLFGPVGLIVAAIVGLVLIFVALWRESEVFRDAVTNAFNAVKDAIMSAVDRIKKVLKENETGIENLKAVFKTLGDFIGNVIIPLWAGYLSKVIEAVSFLIAGLIRYVLFLADAFTTALGVAQDFGGKVSSVFNAVVDTVKSGLEKLGAFLDFFEEIPGKVVGVFASAGSWLYNAGVSVVQGLLNGAGSLLRSIGSFFLNMLPGWIVGPFKAALGIASPSKIFEQLGAFIPEGLINGVNSQKEKVKNASAALAQAATDAAREAAQSALDEAKNGLDKAQKDLQDRVKAIKSYLGQLRGVGREFGSIMNVDLGGVPAGFERAAIGMQLRERLANIRAFTASLKKLRDLGLNTNSLKEIVAAGPDNGLAIAEALLSSGVGGIVEVNDLERQFRQASSAFANVGADVEFGQRDMAGTPAARSAAANQVFITVNAGVGDPREIGRQTVEAIKAYERANGRVFVAAP